jgi:hypothetical protein
MMGIFRRDKRKRFKDGDTALELRLRFTRDNERFCFDLTEISSTMSPFEMMAALTGVTAQLKMWVPIQSLRSEPYASARKFLRDRCGNEWWHKLFESKESLDRINAELGAFMKENYSTNLGGKHGKA